jgi:hypothetical protein
MNKTKKTQARRSFLIGELCKLSRNGWANAKPCDYEPLERELKQLNPKYID